MLCLPDSGTLEGPFLSGAYHLDTQGAGCGQVGDDDRVEFANHRCGSSTKS